MKNTIATNTSSTKTYSLSTIMLRAWAIRKAAANTNACSVSDIHWGACLQMAWSEAEGVNAEANANTVKAEWAATPAEKQVEWLQRCVVRAGRDVVGYSQYDHYHQHNEVAGWGLYGHSLDEYTDEAYCKLYAAFDRLPVTNERRAAKGRRPRTLKALVYNAAKAAIMAIYEQDKRHGRAVPDPEIVNSNGEIESWLETKVSAPGYDTETSAIIRADMAKFVAGRDEIDQKIIELVQEGYTERGISGALQGRISNVAVHKRLTKIRAALLSAGIA